MGIFDMFKKKEEPVVETPAAPLEVVGIEPIAQAANNVVAQPAPVAPLQPVQQPIAQEQMVQENVQQQPVVQQPITQELAQQPDLQSVVPLGQLPDNPFLEPVQPVEPAASETNTVTPPSFDDIFNTQPPIVETPQPVQNENTEITIPNAIDTGAVVDEPKPIVEQQIALNVNPDEVFEGGLTKEDAITKIVAEQTNNEAIPQIDATNSSISNNVPQDNVVENNSKVDGVSTETVILPVISEMQEPTAPAVQPIMEEASAPIVTEEAAPVPEITETPVENVIVPEQNAESNVIQEVAVQPTVSVENENKDNVVTENVAEPTPLVESTSVAEPAPVVGTEIPAEVVAPVVEEKQENVELKAEIAPESTGETQSSENTTIPVIEPSTSLNNQETAIESVTPTEGEQQNTLETTPEAEPVANIATPMENTAPMEENVSQPIVEEVKDNIETTPLDTVSTEPSVDTNVEENVIQPTVPLETNNNDVVTPEIVTPEVTPAQEPVVSEAIPASEPVVPEAASTAENVVLDAAPVQEDVTSEVATTTETVAPAVATAPENVAPEATPAPETTVTEATPASENAVPDVAPIQEPVPSPTIETTETVLPTENVSIENGTQEPVVAQVPEVQVTPEVAIPVVEEPVTNVESVPAENNVITETPAQATLTSEATIPVETPVAAVETPIMPVTEPVIPAAEPVSPVIQQPVQANEENVVQVEQPVEPVSVPVAEPATISQQNVNNNVGQMMSAETNIPVSVTPPTINPETIQPSKTVFCDNCGSIITDETLGVCPNCGEPIK